MSYVYAIGSVENLSEEKYDLCYVGGSRHTHHKEIQKFQKLYLDSNDPTCRSSLKVRRCLADIQVTNPRWLKPGDWCLRSGKRLRLLAH